MYVMCVCVCVCVCVYARASIHACMCVCVYACVCVCVCVLEGSFPVMMFISKGSCISPFFSQWGNLPWGGGGKFSKGKSPGSYFPRSYELCS